MSSGESQKRKTSFKTNGFTRSGFICFLACLIFVFSVTDALAKRRYTAIVIDAETGLILHQSDAHVRVHPASLTKMMTLMMVFEALDNGKLKIHDRITISKHAASMVPSKLDLKPGSTIKVEDAIYALVTKSANDVAVAMAEHLGHTESNFARMMTRKAYKLGMKRTAFKNASGLHHSRQVTTAADMAKLAHVLVYDYSKYYHYFSKQRWTYQGKTYRNHNRLLESYRGMDGLKTGYISAAGFNLVASAERGDRRIIGVVIGGRTSKSRNAQMEKLLNAGFAKLSNIIIARKEIPIPTRKPIQNFDVAVNDILREKPNFHHDLTDEEDFVSADRWALLNITEGNAFTQMIGEGDFDISVRKRLETGLIAISAHTGAFIPPGVFGDGEDITDDVVRNSLAHSSDWSIQIGAFASRERTDKAIAASIQALPPELRNSGTVVAPLKTDNGWIYRGRLNGYTKESAHLACDALPDCIPIPPQLP